MPVSLDFLYKYYPDVFDLWYNGTHLWEESLIALGDNKIEEYKNLYSKYEELRDEYNFAIKLLGYDD